VGYDAASSRNFLPTLRITYQTLADKTNILTRNDGIIFVYCVMVHGDMNIMSEITIV